MQPIFVYPADTLTLVPWSDTTLEATGHDPRSAFVEEFWLGILGPSATWLARRIVASFDNHPDGFEMNLADTARALGLGDRGGRHSPFLRSLNRLALFDLAMVTGPDTMTVRTAFPDLNARQLAKVGPERTRAHDLWSMQSADARTLTHTLLAGGATGRESIGNSLALAGYPPLVIADTLTWARL